MIHRGISGNTEIIFKNQSNPVMLFNKPRTFWSKRNRMIIMQETNDCYTLLQRLLGQCSIRLYNTYCRVEAVGKMYINIYIYKYIRCSVVSAAFDQFPESQRTSDLLTVWFLLLCPKMKTWKQTIDSSWFIIIPSQVVAHKKQIQEAGGVWFKGSVKHVFSFQPIGLSLHCCIEGSKTAARQWQDTCVSTLSGPCRLCLGLPA